MAKQPLWTSSLLTWFRHHQRSMPWRENPIPYYVWVSEMMLQQTQVATVIPYFERFIQQFPTIQSLANTPLDAVLKAWEGLGYYARARNLHKTAKIVATDFHGKFPQTYKELQTLPGIGPYIAAAITSIAFNNPVPVVDGNVLRVFARFWGLSDDIANPKTRTLFFNKLHPYIQNCPPSEFNQAIMEIGALICKPDNPACPECPLQPNCYAATHHLQTQLPQKSAKPKPPHYHVAVGIIWKQNQFLIAKRKTNQMLGGLWELPGGKQKPNESFSQTVEREIAEEVGIQVQNLAEACIVTHAYTHFRITMHVFTCQYKSGSPHPHSSDELKWIHWTEISEFAFPKATLKAFTNLASTNQ